MATTVKIVLFFWTISTIQVFHLVRATETKEANPKNLAPLCDVEASNVVEDLGCRSIPKDATTIGHGTNMMAVRCVMDCWTAKFKFAWTVRTQCMCTHSAQGEMVEGNKCDFVCPGASKQFCGGDEAASLFKTGYVALDRVALHDLYSDVRTAYFASGTSRTANMFKHDDKCIKTVIITTEAIEFTTRLLDRKLCLVHCYHYRHVYALMSSGKNCVCTSWMPETDGHFASGLCNTPCEGRKTETCGGQEKEVYNVMLTGYLLWKKRLSQEFFFFLPALWQKWQTYLRGNNDIWTELLDMGIDLVPGERPPGYGVKQETVEEPDVEIEEEEEGLNIGLVIGGAVGGILVLIIIILMAVLATRKNNTVFQHYQVRDRRSRTSVRSARSDRSRLLD